MTSIKPLPNLKVNALAVTVPEDFHHAEIEFGELGVFITDSSFPELPRAWSWTKLPPGEWNLLGRANEIWFNDLWPLSGVIQQKEGTEKWWGEICRANNLTNELILYDTLG